MKKLIKVSFTGFGLIAIALAIYYKGDCSHSPLPCFSDNCSVPNPSDRPLFYSEHKDEACAFVNSNFILEIGNPSYQNYFINLKSDENYVISARVSDTIEIKGQKKIKSLKFLLLNSEDSYYYISKITQPKFDNGIWYIDLEIVKGKCTTPFIPKEYTYVIEKPKHYIGSGDTIGHYHDPSDWEDLCVSGSREKRWVGGHLCHVSVK